MPPTLEVDRRAIAPSDYEALVALLAAAEQHVTGRRCRLGPDDLREWLTDVKPDVDTWIFEEQGRAVAFGWRAPEGELSFAVGIVHPGERGRGFGGLLVDCAQRRAHEAGSTRLHCVGIVGDPGAPELFAARGFEEVRRFYDMAIELDGAPVEPVLPDGLVLATFAETDALAFYDALDESFRDHWEHHSRPFEQWWELRTSAPDFDPTLWFLVRDGAEVAGVVRNEPNRNGGGYVGALGVRRTWRGRGVGRALLQRTFAEFYRRGVHRISLGVDAQSPTGATRLYESVGMAVELESAVYEKALA